MSTDADVPVQVDLTEVVGRAVESARKAGRRSRGRRAPAAPTGPLRLTCAAVPLVVALSACAPQSPDHSSWSDQAHQTVEDVASNVATDTLLLRLALRDRVTGKYAQIVALDSEVNAGKAADKFGGEQPPTPRDNTTYTHVTGALSDATDVLSQVRIAVVRRDTFRYPALLRSLSETTTQLEKTARDIRKPG